jgi:hypothetical protein
VLHQRNPLTVPCQRRPRKQKRSKKPSPQATWERSNIEKAHAFAEHLTKGFQLHPSENEPEKEEALIQLLKTPYQPTVSKNLKFKKSSTP